MRETINTSGGKAPGECLEVLSRAITQGHHEMAEVCSVACRLGKDWINKFTIVRVGEYAEHAATHYEYEHVLLLRQEMPATLIPDWLASVEQDRLKVAGVNIRMHEMNELRRWERLSGANSLTCYPAELFRSTQNSMPRTVFGPLLHSGAPYFPDPDEATRQWTRVGAYGVGEFTWGDLVAVVPDTRARLKELSYGDGNLIVEIERRRDFEEPLELKAGHRRGEKWVSHDVRLSEDRAGFSVPSDIDQLDIYLLGVGSDVLDRHIEQSRGSIGIPGAVIRSRESRGADALRRVIARGEGERTEFKEWVNLDDRKKSSEVIRTVIAFANTSGGQIAIGVNNACEIVGIGAAHMGRKGNRTRDPDKVRAEYVAGWHQRIGHEISPTPDVDIRFEVVDGHALLVIDVPAGKNRPHTSALNRECFVRRGANNVRPDPRTEWPALLGDTVSRQSGVDLPRSLL